MGPNEQRWNNAIDQIRAKGIIVRENVENPCRCCIKEGLLGMTREEFLTQPWAYTYASRENGYGWENDIMLCVSEDYGHVGQDEEGDEMWIVDPVLEGYKDIVYFNCSNSPQDPSHIIAEIFKENGFEIEWDGSSESTVGIKIPS